MKKKRKQKQKRGKRNSVQELLDIRRFTDYGILTDGGELVFYRVAPTNISVLSAVNIQQKLGALTELLKLYPELGIVCMDSCECFDSNREYLRRRAEAESDPKVRYLLETDMEMLTRMQAEMANAREFLFVQRFQGMKPEMVFTQSNTTLKQMSERGFEAERLKKPELKRLVALYFETCMDGDKLPDVDGGQYQEGENENS